MTSDVAPAFSPPPYSIAAGQIWLAIGAVSTLSLLPVCGMASWRAKRLQFSLLQLLGCCVSLSFAVWGAVQWERAISLARSEEWVAIVDGDLIRKKDVEMGMFQFTILPSASGRERAEWEQEYSRRFDHSLRELSKDWLMYKAAKQEGFSVKASDVDPKLCQASLAADTRFSTEEIRSRLELDMLAFRYLQRLVARRFNVNGSVRYLQGILRDGELDDWIIQSLNRREQYVFVNDRPSPRAAEWFVQKEVD